MALKLAVLQRVINAGETNHDAMPVALADVWKIARTTGGSHLEYDPTEFANRICQYLKIRLTEYDKEIHPWYSRKKVKRIDKLYTPDEVDKAFRAAWNDVTREIKRQTVKVL